LALPILKAKIKMTKLSIGVGESYYERDIIDDIYSHTQEVMRSVNRLLQAHGLQFVEVEDNDLEHVEYELKKDA